MSSILQPFEDQVSALGRRWKLRDISAYEHIPTYDGATRIQGEIAFSRGCRPDKLPGLMDPSLIRHMPDPFVMVDMERAAKRLASAIKDNETILVFGDYDVDGATSAAILRRFLKMARATNVVTHVPDRDNGYGFGDENCENAISEYPDLIVLLDCGTQNHSSIAKTGEMAIDVLVVDHHQPAETLPSAYAIVNPHRHDESIEGQELRNLCTAGLAFMLVTAVNRELRTAGWYENFTAPALMSLMDLVALGTVCDVMKLTGLNRSFVTLGLKQFEKGENLGIQALASVAGVKDGATATTLGFHLGPRINAGGRIGQARLGADLLASDDHVFCEKVAAELNQLNHERRDIENAVLEEATAQVNPDDDIIVVAQKGWHHGVIGIVAGRLKESFNRPAIVIGIDEFGVGKGSGRSIAGVDLGRAIMDAVLDKKLVGGGGHVMACGLTIDPEKVQVFREYLNSKIGEQSSKARQENATLFDATLFTSDITPGFVVEIEQLGPYGQGWPKPRFILGPCRATAINELKGGHVKFQIVDDNGTINAMAFRAVENGFLDLLTSGEKLFISGQADLNTFRGMTSLQFMVDDIMVQ